MKRMGKRRDRLVLILVWTLAAISFELRLHAQQSPEQMLLNAVNQDRAANGLGPLKWDPALAAAASGHAEWMAGERQLAHQYQGEPDLVTRASQQGAHF